MYSANLQILYSNKEKTELAGYWAPDINVSGLRYSKQIEFHEELINFVRTWLL